MNHNRNCSGCPEQVSYNCKEHPAYIRKDLLSHYPDFSAVSHWHEDLEILYPLNGTVTIWVDKKTYLLKLIESFPELA